MDSAEQLNTLLYMDGPKGKQQWNNILRHGCVEIVNITVTTNPSSLEV